MNVHYSLLVIRMLCVPTHLGRTLVLAMKDTLEMEGHALVRCLLITLHIFCCVLISISVANGINPEFWDEAL